VAVPIEPVTPRPARRGASVVLTVPRPQANGGNRAASNAKVRAHLDMANCLVRQLCLRICQHWISSAFLFGATR
jgi:hypothetical protein